MMPLPVYVSLADDNFSKGVIMMIEHSNPTPNVQTLTPAGNCGWDLNGLGDLSLRYFCYEFVGCD